MTSYERGVLAERKRILTLIEELIAEEERYSQDNAMAVLGALQKAVQPDADKPMERYRSSETPYRPYTVPPWHEGSYGPHVIIWIQSLAYDVRDKFGRPEAARIIRLFGGYSFAEVKPENYEILSRALRMRLTGIDPGPAAVWQEIFNE